MAQTILTKDSPEIIRFTQCVQFLKEALSNNPEKYRPILNGERYITENELIVLLKVTRRTLIEHRTKGVIPFYKLGRRILYKENDIIHLLEKNKVEAFKGV